MLVRRGKAKENRVCLLVGYLPCQVGAFRSKYVNVLCPQKFRNRDLMYASDLESTSRDRQWRHLLPTLVQTGEQRANSFGYR